MLHRSAMRGNSTASLHRWQGRIGSGTASFCEKYPRCRSASRSGTPCPSSSGAQQRCEWPWPAWSSRRQCRSLQEWKSVRQESRLFTGNLHIFHIYFFCGGKFRLSVCKSINPLSDAALYRSTSIHHTPDSYTKRNLVGAGPLHLAYARPFGRLKAPLGLSLLRFAAQTRTTLFLLCTKSCIVWRKIGVWRSFRWKSVKRKSLKLLGTSRSFRLCFA